MTTQRPPTTAILVVNAKSRRGLIWFKLARQRLRELGVPLESARLYASSRAMRRAIIEAKERGVETILVGGGDGTLNEAAHILSGSKSILGVIPLGTGNAFARDLGIRTEVAHACEVIAAGRSVAVDLGEIGGKPFLNVASVGMTTAVAMSLNPTLKRFLGPLAYLWPVVRALHLAEPFQVTLDIAGQSHHFDSLQVIIGNGRYHAGRFILAPDAGLKSGELLVYSVTGTSKSLMFRFALQLMRGKHVDMKEVEVFRCTSGHIETSPRRSITVDGERLLKTPADFRVISNALKVYVPETFIDNDFKSDP